MSALTRRTVLKGSALAGAAAAVPAGAAALRQAGLVVFDSRLPESLAFARTAGAVQTLDLAAEHDAHFATIRSGVPQGKSLEGLTRELLRPMLAEWLEANLPTMVESLVQAEIARIVGKRR